MDSQGAPAALGQDLEISTGLRRFDDAEGVLLSGHRQIGCVVTGDLQEDSAVGATFVGLAGGVQESRTEAEAGRDVLLVAHAMTQFLQKRLRAPAFISM